MRRLGYGDDGSLGDMREVRRWAGVSGVDKEGSGDHEIIPVFWGVSFGDRGSQRGSEDVCDSLCLHPCRHRLQSMCGTITQCVRDTGVVTVCVFMCVMRKGKVYNYVSLCI